MSIEGADCEIGWPHDIWRLGYKKSIDCSFRQRHSSPHFQVFQ